MALTGKQHKELERAISKRRDALQAELRGDVERSREDVFSEVGGAVTDSGDAAQADVIADTDNAELSRDLAELRELQAAQARLADGSYGLCADCGRNIGVNRLRAAPGARRCVACQRKHETGAGGRKTASL